MFMEHRSEPPKQHHPGEAPNAPSHPSGPSNARRPIQLCTFLPRQRAYAMTMRFNCADARATLFTTEVEAPLNAARRAPRPPADPTAVPRPPPKAAMLTSKRVNALKLDDLQVDALNLDACRPPHTPPTATEGSPCSSGCGIQERLRWPASGAIKKYSSPKASPLSVLDCVPQQMWPLATAQESAHVQHLKDIKNLELACLREVNDNIVPLSGLSPAKANCTLHSSATSRWAS